jgi:transposase
MKMTTDTPRPTRYPLLENLLAHRGLHLQATYSVRDVAEIFDVSVRAIQERVKRQELNSRNLPGRAKFLSIDLEEFVKNSSRPRLKTA